MGTKANPTVIGAFVVGAVILVVAGLLLFSSGTFLSVKRTFVLYFDGSVQGLNVGAPVVFRGVEVGKVSNIVAVFDPENTEVRIQVFIDIVQGSVNIAGDASLIDREKVIAALIDRGLRASLQVQSMVTGLLYVDLDMHPDTPIKLSGAGRAYPELPTVPSKMDRLLAAVQNTVAEFGKLPIDQLLGELLNIFGRVDSLLALPEVAHLIVSADELVMQVRQLVQHADSGAQRLATSLTRTSDTASKALDDVCQLVRDIAKQVAPLATNVATTSTAAQVALKEAQQFLVGAETEVRDEITTTLKQLRKTLVTYEGLASSKSPVLRDLEQTLSELAGAARSIRVLADYLQRHPSALIYGKGRSGGR
ncbi:hypothetical protein NKDENANG_00050 [Candidatus Entotheonellaceae bacterium PAL068K]